MLLVAMCHSRSSGRGTRFRAVGVRVERDCTLFDSVAARSTPIIALCITPLAFCSCMRMLPAWSACFPSPPPPKGPALSSSFRPVFAPLAACLASMRRRLSRMSVAALASSRAFWSKCADLTGPWPSRTHPNVVATLRRLSPMLMFISSSFSCRLSLSSPCSLPRWCMIDLPMHSILAASLEWLE